MIKDKIILNNMNLKKIKIKHYNITLFIKLFERRLFIKSNYRLKIRLY